MVNKTFKIIFLSTDSKKFEDTCSSLYLDVPEYGVIGITPDRISYCGMIYIGFVYYYKDNIKNYVAVSGGLVNFRDNVATILTDTFERSDELDEARILKAKERAEMILNKHEDIDQKTYDDAMFSLKKSLNRLKLLGKK